MADKNNNRDNTINGVNNADEDNSLWLDKGEKEYPYKDLREETAAEFAPQRGFVRERPFIDNTDEEIDADRDGEVTEGRGVGAFAIVLSIISLFFLPVILGAAGIIVGFIARKNGARSLGNWAIGIGAISIILTLFFSPFF